MELYYTNVQLLICYYVVNNYAYEHCVYFSVIQPRLIPSRTLCYSRKNKKIQENANGIIKGFVYNTCYLKIYEIFMITIKYLYKINAVYTQTVSDLVSSNS
jgi:hypothetical protein